MLKLPESTRLFLAVSEAPAMPDELLAEFVSTLAKEPGDFVLSSDGESWMLTRDHDCDRRTADGRIELGTGFGFIEPEELAYPRHQRDAALVSAICDAIGDAVGGWGAIEE